MPNSLSGHRVNAAAGDLHNFNDSPPLPRIECSLGPRCSRGGGAQTCCALLDTPLSRGHTRSAQREFFTRHPVARQACGTPAGVMVGSRAVGPNSPHRRQTWSAPPGAIRGPRRRGDHDLPCLPQPKRPPGTKQPAHAGHQTPHRCHQAHAPCGPKQPRGGGEPGFPPLAKNHTSLWGSWEDRERWVNLPGPPKISTGHTSGAAPEPKLPTAAISRGAFGPWTRRGGGEPLMRGKADG